MRFGMKVNASSTSLRAAATERTRLDLMRGGLGLGQDRNAAQSWTTAYAAAGKAGAGKPIL